MKGGGVARSGFLVELLPHVEAQVDPFLRDDFQDTYDQREALYKPYVKYSSQPGQPPEDSMFGQWSLIVLDMTGVPPDDAKLVALCAHAQTMLRRVDEGYDQLGVYGY
jgi:hypothetical protein